MADYDFGAEPRVVGINLTESTHAYLQRCLALGAVEGPLGGMTLSPELVPLLQAMHAVLAGGKATVTIENAGLRDVVEELDVRLAAGTRDANAINQAAGYAVTVPV